MDILKGCVTRFRKEEENEDASNFNHEAPYENIFRKSEYASQKKINTEAVLLLEEGSKLISYSKRERNRRRHVAKWKKEMQTLNDVINNADVIDSFKRRAYNIDYQNYKKPICTYAGSRNFNDNMEKANIILKKKYEVLKREHKDMLKNMDAKINLELIKAGVFYNRDDVLKIFELVRGQQTDLNTQKKVVEVQNNIIESIMANNSLNKRRLKISQKKIQKLVEMCTYYFQESIHTKKNMKNIKHIFLEYKMALENVVHCCEQIGGDKIALMDGIKMARAQTDLSAATYLLKLKEVDELKKNLTYYEQKIKQLEVDLKTQLKNLSAETKDKLQAQMQIKSVRQELTINNKLLLEVFDCFQEIMHEIEYLLKEVEDRNNIKLMSITEKEKYNAILKKIPEHVSSINLEEPVFDEAEYLKLEEEMRKQEEYLLQQQLELEKAEREKEKKEEMEAEQKKKELEEEEERKKQEEERKRQEEEKEAEDELRKLKNVEQSVITDKINALQSSMHETQLDKFNYDQCIDFIYKLNLPLTQEQCNELKEKNELTKEELSTFVKSLVQNEEDILDNMVTFFEIWDVKKSGLMKKDLFVFILEHFGDQFSQEESTFLQKEMNSTNGPNVYYVDILKKWIYGEIKE